MLKLLLLQTFSKGLVASIYYGQMLRNSNKLNNQIVSASNENFRHRKIRHGSRAHWEKQQEGVAKV
jgi:hypothetical protein